MDWALINTFGKRPFGRVRLMMPALKKEVTKGFGDLWLAWERSPLSGAVLGHKKKTSYSPREVRFNPDKHQLDWKRFIDCEMESRAPWGTDHCQIPSGHLSFKIRDSAFPSPFVSLCEYFSRQVSPGRL
ncbi:hypothetical protein CEXT_524361 [Caerostris extrusa]|uniref:Uncharacterized protein n=1 Tax=Caerostris extrusa TaxID=172846 RepID=A0AAV4XMP5_CAEEX|nr:hypothetical protein CEXT_524361 [Caerostris extrusa]